MDILKFGVDTPYDVQDWDSFREALDTVYAQGCTTREEYYYVEQGFNLLSGVRIYNVLCDYNIENPKAVILNEVETAMIAFMAGDRSLDVKLLLMLMLWLYDFETIQTPRAIKIRQFIEDSEQADTTPLTGE